MTPIRFCSLVKLHLSLELLPPASAICQVTHAAGEVCEVASGAHQNGCSTGSPHGVRIHCKSFEGTWWSFFLDTLQPFDVGVPCLIPSGFFSSAMAVWDPKLFKHQSVTKIVCKEKYWWRFGSLPRTRQSNDINEQSAMSTAISSSSGLLTEPSRAQNTRENKKRWSCSALASCAFLAALRPWWRHENPWGFAINNPT